MIDVYCISPIIKMGKLGKIGVRNYSLHTTKSSCCYAFFIYKLDRDQHSQLTWEYHRHACFFETWDVFWKQVKEHQPIWVNTQLRCDDSTFLDYIKYDEGDLIPILDYVKENFNESSCDGA